MELLSPLLSIGGCSREVPNRNLFRKIRNKSVCWGQKIGKERKVEGGRNLILPSNTRCQMELHFPHFHFWVDKSVWFQVDTSYQGNEKRLAGCWKKCCMQLGFNSGFQKKDLLSLLLLPNDSNLKLQLLLHPIAADSISLLTQHCWTVFCVERKKRSVPILKVGEHILVIINIWAQDIWRADVLHFSTGKISLKWKEFSLNSFT